MGGRLRKGGCRSVVTSYGLNKVRFRIRDHMHIAYIQRPLIYIDAQVFQFQLLLLFIALA